MAMISVAIPPAAVAHRLRGELFPRRRSRTAPPATDAVLFDRDGTLVHDVPVQRRPERWFGPCRARSRRSAPAAGRRRAGRRGTTNQSGIGRGRSTANRSTAVNARVEELLGPFDTWQLCPHDARRRLRVPQAPSPAGLQRRPGARVPADRCVVIGDIGADVGRGRGGRRPRSRAGADSGDQARRGPVRRPLVAPTFRPPSSSPWTMSAGRGGEPGAGAPRLRHDGDVAAGRTGRAGGRRSAAEVPC